VANHLPVVLASLTFDSVDLQRSDLSVHLDIVAGLNDGLDVRGQDTVIPTATGRTPRTRKGDVRHILLAGVLQGTGSTEAVRLASWQNLRDELEAVFDPTADPATLVGMANDGTWRSIEARTVAIVWNPSTVFGVGELSISLDAADPTWEITGGGS
jgi:hypothetical protein